MKKVSEIVQRIESHYVGDDCCQIMLPFGSKATIISNDGILFHKSHDDLINSYLSDERRKRFPYSNIPIHFFEDNLCGKIGYTNQLINFDTPVVRIGSGCVIESFAVKDNSSALFVSNVLYSYEDDKFISWEKILCRDDVLKLLTAKEGEEVFYVTSEGEWYTEIPFVEEEKIIDLVRHNMHNNISEVRMYIERSNDSLGNYIVNNAMLNFMQECCDKVDFGILNLNANLYGNDIMFVVRIIDGEISIKGFKIRFVSRNKYLVHTYDIPVTKYTLEQLKFTSLKIEKTREPKISLKSNPNISKQDIQEAKRMVKSLRR